VSKCFYFALLISCSFFFQTTAAITKLRQDVPFNTIKGAAVLGSLVGYELGHSFLSTLAFISFFAYMSLTDGEAGNVLRLGGDKTWTFLATAYEKGGELTVQTVEVLGERSKAIEETLNRQMREQEAALLAAKEAQKALKESQQQQQQQQQIKGLTPPPEFKEINIDEALQQAEIALEEASMELPEGEERADVEDPMGKDAPELAFFMKFADPVVVSKEEEGEEEE